MLQFYLYVDRLLFSPAEMLSVQAFTILKSKNDMLGRKLKPHIMRFKSSAVGVRWA